VVEVESGGGGWVASGGVCIWARLMEVGAMSSGGSVQAVHMGAKTKTKVQEWRWAEGMHVSSLVVSACGWTNDEHTHHAHVGQSQPGGGS
jgi:hypothetical protein